MIKHIVMWKLKNFAEGIGKPLFDQWQIEIRAGMFDLIMKDEMLDHEVMRLLDKVRDRVKMIAQAQVIIDETIG